MFEGDVVFRTVEGVQPLDTKAFYINNIKNEGAVKTGGDTETERVMAAAAVDEIQ